MTDRANNRVLVMAGYPGHDREITVNFGSYDHPFDRPIPANVEDVVRQMLPESWKIDNRSTRLEIHPSGRFAGGFDALDLHAVRDALTEIGFVLVYSVEDLYA